MERLCRLLGEGRAQVTVSGAYRFAAPPHREAHALLGRLVAANPERCLWGSGWPHIMLGEKVERPDAGVPLDASMRAVGGSEARRRVLVADPATLHGF